MRIAFFTATTVPAVTMPAKKIDEESLDQDSVNSSAYSEEDSTSLEDASFELLDDGTPLPEMNEAQAHILKRLLLSPLEPDTDF